MLSPVSFSDEEGERDYDIRGLARINKNAAKKLKGARKRKEEKLTAGVSGTDFQMDVTDDRFASLMDGADARFGIDRTDPNFKETPAMKDILAEQSKRRRRQKKDSKNNKRAKTGPMTDQKGEGNNSKSEGGGDTAGTTNPDLSSLVDSIKRKARNQ
jgi:hypothetical protein